MTLYVEKDIQNNLMIKKSNPSVTCVKILKSYFKKDEYQEETVNMKSRENILG